MESELPPRFLTHPQTVEMIDLARGALNSLTYDVDTLSRNQNTGTTHPYESAALFIFDRPGRDRASALAYSPANGLEYDDRTDFVRDSILGRSLIQSQSSLGDAVKEDGPDATFRTSRMNPDAQMVWTQPLYTDAPGYGDEPIAAVQLTYTLNQNPNWIYPGNDELEDTWKDHRPLFNEVARSLSGLALYTDSLARSLEMEPPVSPNAFVIQWDMRNSTTGALSDSYGSLSAFLDRWKRERDRVTGPYKPQIIDGGDGEFIILQFDKLLDIHNPHAIRKYGTSHVQPLLDAMMKEQARIAAAYAPDLFPKLRFGVGLGYVEPDDGDRKPTGQVIWEIARATANTPKQLIYTEEAANALGIDQ